MTSQSNTFPNAGNGPTMDEDASPATLNPILLLPGLILLAVIGIAGKWIEATIKAYGVSHHKALPNIEYVLWAIVIGLIIGNLFGGMKWFKVFAPGIATYEFWLKLGIVLLGTRFLLKDVVRMGGTSLGLIAIEIAFAFVLMMLFGKIFKLGPKLTALLAVGSSICGVSAIIAAQGAIDADEKDSSYAIAAILALGALSLISYPAIGHALHLSDRAYGTWCGLSVDNTAETTAAGALYSPEAKDVAVLTKTVRNATIGFVVLIVALYFASKTGNEFTESKVTFLWRTFPKFVIGFLLFSALASMGPRVFSPAQVVSLGNLSKWAFLLTFAGVGLRTNIFELFQQGPKPFLVGALAEIFIAVVTLGMVLVADKALGGL